MVDKSCEVVEKGHDEFRLVIVPVGELRLGFVAFLSRNESNRWEFAEETLSLLFFHSILQVALVEEVVGYLSDVGMAAVLRSQQNRGLTLVLKSHK